MRQYGPLIRRLKLWPRGAFSFAKLKRCRVMDVLRLVATSTARDGTIAAPSWSSFPTGPNEVRNMPERCRSPRGRPRPAVFGSR